MFTEQKVQVNLKRAASRQKLHTIHALLRGRLFDGTFEVLDKTYSFVFIPKSAALVEKKLVLTGRMSFTIPRRGTRFVDGVTATLVAQQGGVGVSPARRQLLTRTVQTAQTVTSEQKLELEKGPETELQPGLHSFEPPKYDELGRPLVESTDALAFVGVLYFKLSPLNNRKLGIPLDMNELQLGGRLAPTDDLARDLQLVFSDIVKAIDPKAPDQIAASAALETLNSAFTY